MVELFSYFLFVVFSSIVEGFLWSRKGHQNPSGLDPKNIHVWLVLMRCTVWIPLWLSSGWEWVAVAIFTFPMIHDGIYYYTRDLIDGSYPKGFFATSTSSTALLTLDFKWRAFLFCSSIIFLI